MGEDLYKMMLVAYLHDVGKLLQRAGDREDTCALGEGFHEHDEFSCGFMKRYLGEEYEKLFKSSGWKKSDYASASERIRREGTREVSTTPLLHPAKDREEEGNCWYPVTFLSWSAPSGTYFLDNKTAARSRINYKNIVKELRRLAREISTIEDPLCLLETYEYVMRTVGTLVPAAVYMAQPNTSIYGHSRLASSIYPATRTGKYSLFLVDTKGIQRFVTNVKGESEASKRLRGRSFFLQLLQQAMVDRIASVLQLSEVNNISFEPGRLIFMVPGRPEEKKREVENLLQEISKWSEFELQFTTSLSDEKEISKLKFYVEEEERSNKEMKQGKEQDREERKSNFEEALDQIFKEQRLVVFPSILERPSQDKFGEVTSKWIEVDDENISWLNTLAPGEFEVGDKLSIMNLISLIVGHSARNLKAVVEVIENDLKGEKGEPSEKDRTRDEYEEEFAYYSQKGARGESVRIGKIRIAPLGISFYLIHSPETRDIDVTPVVESLISTLRRETNRVKVFKINDPLNFVFNLSDKSNLTFGYMIVNTFHPVEKDTGVTGLKFKTLDLMGDFIGMGSIDGDEIGTLVKTLSRYPSRFMTFSVLLNFVFTYYMVKRIEEISGNDTIDVVLLYSGGDDLVVYGRWEDTLRVLADLAEGVERMLGYITVSGGFTVFKPAYPLYRAYYESREFEEIAKREKKELGKKGGYVAGNVLEPYLEDVSRRGVRIYSWEDVKKTLEKADSLMKETEIPNGYLYKLHQLGTEIFESVLDSINSDERGNVKYGERASSLETWKARSLVSYAYMNARNPETFAKASKILDLIPYPGGPATEDEVIRSIVRARTAIQFYSLKSRNTG
ncbi:Cas10/Cmr2 second palm domain-containing protein [Sulfuracidifex tepidarius]|uniref:Uncharacterized protein n=1 Tax=Sulfuracidifex tepidarius TaxID=1294262 RepID=A0A510E5G0_9CREN|nr:hydrolase [Sulfuracidifex tepidarius]BBG27761.1 hypothetical protein IC007_2315 [Sulfuracidifex tepidarius]